MFWLPVHCAQCQHEVDVKREAWEVERREKQVRDELREARLPIAYATGARTLADIPNRAIVNRCAGRLVSGAEPGLYLHGRPGTCKTSFAAGFLASQILDGRFGRYVSSIDLLRDVQATYSREGDETCADIVRRYTLTPRLVFDDIGKEKASEHASGVIYQILDGRYRMQERGRWTILTSEFSLPELAARFATSGEAIERRIAELTVTVEMRRAA